jgi:hypothetical protein
MNTPDRLRRTLIALAVALGAVFALAAAPVVAHAATTYPSCNDVSGNTSCNRPSTVEVGGAEYETWADTSAAGAVHVAELGSSATWSDPNGSNTYYGSGPTIAAHRISATQTVIVVAWADTQGYLHLAELGAKGQLACEILFYDLNSWPSNFPPTQFADATPYLTSEGDDGYGNLYLTWADADYNELHVSQIYVPSTCSGDSFGVISNVNIDTETSFDGPAFDGPALTVSGYGTGSEDYWLMWAGTDSAHHLNIAEYNTSWGQVSKHTETDHSTVTDMGAAYATAYKQIWMSYCGTNGVAYYQEFTTTDGGSEQHVSGTSCSVTQYTTGGITYYSGGVGVGYEYSDQFLLLTWANSSEALTSAYE